jgi:hypothetical protein
MRTASAVACLIVGLVIGKQFATPELRLNAFGAHGDSRFVIGAGPVDTYVDGVFCVDAVTGTLSGFVVHPRSGKFRIAFKTDITRDLPVEQGKSPAYGLSIGRIGTATFSDIRIGNSIVYVADCNTGRVAAYAFPWSSNVKDVEFAADEFIRLDLVKSRELKLRDK